MIALWRLAPSTCKYRQAGYMSLDAPRLAQVNILQAGCTQPARNGGWFAIRRAVRVARGCLDFRLGWCSSGEAVDLSVYRLAHLAARDELSVGFRSSFSGRIRWTDVKTLPGLGSWGQKPTCRGPTIWPGEPLLRHWRWGGRALSPFPSQSGRAPWARFVSSATLFRLRFSLQVTKVPSLYVCGAANRTCAA